MNSFWLVLSRFSLAAWIGAASLFVVTGIAEVQSPEFDSTTKSALALLRFPYYYRFGFTLVGLGLLATWRAKSTIPPVQRRLALGFIEAALIVMTADYFLVYQPLAGMLAEPVRSAGFQTYHEASKYVNFASLGLVLVAAMSLCGEHKPSTSGQPMSST